MPIYSLWCERDNSTIDHQEARDDAHAVAIFSKQLGVELTLDEGLAGAQYMMRRTEEHEVGKPAWVKPPNIPVWVKSPISSN